MIERGQLENRPMLLSRRAESVLNHAPGGHDLTGSSDSRGPDQLATKVSSFASNLSAQATERHTLTRQAEVAGEKVRRNSQ